MTYERMYQKILKTHENKTPKGVGNLRKTHKKDENSSSKKTHKINSISKKEKNRKWITQRTKTPRFLGHGRGIKGRGKPLPWGVVYFLNEIRLLTVL